MRIALPVPRLEIRRDRPMRRSAVGAGVEPDFARRIKLRSYPLVERGGVLWTYMGPPEHQPGCRNTNSPWCRRSTTTSPNGLQYCNWLQALEGGIDSSHVSWLHRDALRSDPLMAGSRGNQYNMGDMRAGVRDRRSSGRVVHRRAPRRRTRHVLLAHHAVVHAGLHHDRAARQSLRCMAISGSRSTTRTAGRGVSITIRHAL